MSDLFLFRLLLTLVTGSAWIFLTVLAGSHSGSKLGGFIGGLPSTALLSFFFIGFTQSPEAAAEATTTFPLGMGISGIFLVMYAWGTGKGFITGLSAGLAAWFALSFLIVLLRPGNFLLNLLIYLAVLLCTYYILEKILLIRSVSGTKTQNKPGHLVVRSLFGGIVIMLTVLIAKAGGPLLGGIFAAFPSMFITTLTITYKVNGIEFSRAMTKSLLVTGMITLAVFAVALRYMLVPAGLYYGTLLAVIISGISAYLTLKYILPRLT